MQAPIDVVYLWVDGDAPGFGEKLNSFARAAPDREPSRYRDNLDLLKYSLRGLAKHLPWVRNVYIVTCSPQRPRWLATTDRIRVVHHEEFIDSDKLPLFNSNAIFCFLERLPELSRQFIYCEDDILWTAPTAISHFVDADGRLRVHQRLGHTPDAEATFGPDALPVNPSWAYNNALLDAAFGKQRRSTHTHAPLLVDRDLWQEYVRKWPKEIERTKSNRFRSKMDVISVYLYRHYLLNTGRARLVSRWKTYREAHYHGLEYFKPWVWIGLNLIRVLKPNTTCLNDNWSGTPPAGIAAMVRQFLDRTFPDKSPFEEDEAENPDPDIAASNEALAS